MTESDERTAWLRHLAASPDARLSFERWVERWIAVATRAVLDAPSGQDAQPRADVKVYEALSRQFRDACKEHDGRAAEPDPSRARSLRGIPIVRA